MNSPTLTPTLTPDIQRKITELRASRPYDGRRVTLCEERCGWKYTGLSGICMHLAADHHCMVLVVEHDPKSYWPIGMEILAELDHETVPMFEMRKSPLLVRVDDDGELIQDAGPPTHLDLKSNIVLDDISLWEAYLAACQARQGAAQVVLNNLRKPRRDEINELPTPTSAEIQGLAHFYVTERLRACRKPDPRIVMLAAPRVELRTTRQSPSSSPEMTEALRSKGWIDGELYSVSRRGQAWLDMAAVQNVADRREPDEEPGTPMTTCPSCDTMSSVTFTREEERFPYGAAPHTVELTALVDKGRCAACKFEFTDWRAEEAYDKAVQNHLAARKEPA